MRGHPSTACIALALTLACGGGGGGSDVGRRSADAALSSLSVSAGALSPAFAPATLAYRLDLPEAAATFTVTPTAHDPRARRITVALGGAAPADVASGAASTALAAPAPGGRAALAVVVTAEDGTVQAYAVTVTRASSASTDLCGTAAPVTVADEKLPPEPTIPAVCAAVAAAYGVDAATGLPAYDQTGSAPDTSRIQAAIDGCTAGAVKLAVDPADATHTAFLSGPLQLKSNVVLLVDGGVTLFASRYPHDYDKTATPVCGRTTSTSSGCKPFISAQGAAGAPIVAAGIMGQGTIDGLGGEPMVGGSDTKTSWWDYANAAGGTFSNPRLVDVGRAKSFTLHGIRLQNSPKFHVGLESDGFMVWGVTIRTPSRRTNSAGEVLSPALARNTDGIDPYDANDGWIVFSTISTGDDQIALKCGDANPAGGAASCHDITIAHDHLGSGHGLSIGSETNGGKTDGTGVGVDGLHVYDVSIDGLVPNGGAGNVNLNGLRIKSDRGRGGIVRNVEYRDVCMRGLANPILLNPSYDTGASGTAYPTFASIAFKDVRHVDCSGSASVPAAGVTLFGYDGAHLAGVTLDGVTIDGISAAAVKAQYAGVTLGPGAVNFTPSNAPGPGVAVTDLRSGSSSPNACAGKFVAIPAAE